jgi:hypothetical protein
MHHRPDSCGHVGDFRGRWCAFPLHRGHVDRADDRLELRELEPRLTWSLPYDVVMKRHHDHVRFVAHTTALGGAGTHRTRTRPATTSALLGLRAAGSDPCGPIEMCDSHQARRNSMVDRSTLNVQEILGRIGDAQAAIGAMDVRTGHPLDLTDLRRVANTLVRFTHYVEHFRETGETGLCTGPCPDACGCDLVDAEIVD